MAWLSLTAVLAVLLGSTALAQEVATPAALRGDDATAWRTTRAPEIHALFAAQVYGVMPAAPERVVVRQRATHTQPGMQLRELRVTWPAPRGEAGFDLLLALPEHTEGPVPAFVGLNFYGNHAVTDAPVALTETWLPSRAKGVVDHRATDAARGTAEARWALAETTARGFAVATLYHGDLAPDDARLAFREPSGLYQLYGGATERSASDWGALAMWAFGLHRALDALRQVAEVDGDRVYVMGHSRNGKTALLAGATDARFRGVISNHSGCGGAALSKRRHGETVAAINRRFPHWFARAFRAYDDDEASLPVDQHLLLALCAPRALLVCSAAEDAWADPEGERLATLGATPVYELLGAPPPTYRRRSGKHGVGPEDWRAFAAWAAAHERGRRAVPPRFW